MNQKCKVGDLIIGNESSDARYMMTNSNAICEVLKVCDNEIRVKIKEFTNGNVVNGYLARAEFMVLPSYFDLYTKDYKVDLI